MFKKGLVIVFALLFALQFAFALETNIKINTISNGSLSINFLNPESENLADYKFNTTTISNTGDGLVDIKFVNNALVFHLEIFVMDDSGVILHEKFKNLNAGEDINLILFPGIPKESMLELVSEEVVETTAVSNEDNITNELLVNKTTEENNVTVFSDEQITGNVAKNNNENKTNTSLMKKISNKFLGIIGFAVEGDGEGNSYSKFIFYFVAAFILLGVLFFVVGKVKNNLGKSERKEIYKKEERKEQVASNQDDDDDGDSYVKDAENKIAEAETEMRIADEAKRLKEVKDRLNRDKEYLRRIRDSRRD